MHYKLIAFDMDGTLLNDSKQIPRQNLDALWEAADRGCHIVPATGRMLSGLPEQLHDPRVRYHILINGALVFDSLENRIIYQGNIPLEQAVELCSYLDKLPVIYDCYIENEGFMSSAMCDAAEPYFEKSRNMFRYVLDSRTRVSELAAFMKQKGTDIQKMQIYFLPSQEDLRQQLLKELPHIFPHFAATTSLPNNIEINSINAGKDKGLEALCKALDINISRTIAFGDGSNDTSMLACAGLGVAMANAEDEVKSSANAIAPCNNEAGVGLFISELIASGQI